MAFSGHVRPQRQRRSIARRARPRRARELDADFTAGWINLAGALLALDQPAEALTAAERALALAPDSAEAENTLGSVLAALARDPEARAALASLPHILGVNPENMPTAASAATYVAAGGAPWDLRAADGVRLKIGLAWSGSPASKINRRRSCPVEFLAPLLARPEIAFYGLQVGPAAADLAANPAIEDISPRLGDFADTAAAVGGLDLVISIDSAAAHLAGALGHPVWVMLSHGGVWRNLRGGADNPWYPTMRHFRQPAPGDWSAVVRAVQTALDDFQPAS